MNYEDIFSRFYAIITDPGFFNMPQEQAYADMTSWLNGAASEPYIRKIFKTLDLDDEIMTLDYTLNDSFGQENQSSDDKFVIEIFAQYMKICWMRQKIDSALNLAVMIGGKEEKKVKDNYKTNIERVDKLELNLKKMVRDHGYFLGDYEV